MQHTLAFFVRDLTPPYWLLANTVPLSLGIHGLQLNPIRKSSAPFSSPSLFPLLGALAL
ncbi:hypothetical protein NSMM_480095 [Nitrosomonas mobilis]|uniref:Uncharacterized protein n=1 Tax=Nitrosomonas mobilis TaxID=51642 RepID=A0A1G5SFX1_9PROT|nr:hypothetical protein NSMM_480095 [Nitrosomonas mobilis]